MDYEELKKAVKEALSKLPATLIVPLIHLIFRHMGELSTSFPAVRDALEPHIKSAMVLKASGILDTAEMQQALIPVLQEYLVANNHVMTMNVAQIKVPSDGQKTG